MLLKSNGCGVLVATHVALANLLEEKKGIHELAILEEKKAKFILILTTLLSDIPFMAFTVT